MVSQNPRTISTEGLLIEHFLTRMRGIELVAMNDQSDAFIDGCIRRVAIEEELDRREIARRRGSPQLGDVKRRAVCD